MKLMILGHAQHGKDTAAEILKEEFGLKFMSSSLFVAERAVRPALALKGITYDSLETCYADRANFRSDWFEAISAYNTPNPARLGLELFEEYDMYVGLRSLREFVALDAARAFDAAIWIDRNTRVIFERRSSMELSPNLCDFLVDNNHDLESLRLQLRWVHSRAERAIASRPYAEKGLL